VKLTAYTLDPGGVWATWHDVAAWRLDSGQLTIRYGVESGRRIELVDLPAGVIGLADNGPKDPPPRSGSYERPGEPPPRVRQPDTLHVQQPRRRP
jgi:hypothetical protein